MNKKILSESLSPEEQLFMEKALSTFRETKQVADKASDGNVFNAIEGFIAGDGRKLLAEMFQGVLAETVQETQKEVDKTCPDCNRKMRNAGKKKKM